MLLQKGIDMAIQPVDG